MNLLKTNRQKKQIVGRFAESWLSIQDYQDGLYCRLDIFLSFKMVTVFMTSLLPRIKINKKVLLLPRN